MCVHAILLVVLALISLPIDVESVVKDLVLLPSPEETDVLEDFQPDSLIDAVPEDAQLHAAIPAISDPTDAIDLTAVDEIQLSVAALNMSEITDPLQAASDLLRPMNTLSGEGFEGRGAGTRQALVRQRGGNDASERAVALGLKWLAAHQYPDGGWNFDHRFGPCQGRCGEAGSMAESRNAATAIALLPFLGAGQTHMKGEYQTIVERGLSFLVQRMSVTSYGGSLYEKGGRMYSHGLAAIALSEAYAMTRDKELFQPAQQALKFIVYAQDPVGGGWRYEPRTPGDTSVVGWQLMALKSGSLAYIDVPANTVRGVDVFLNSVQKSGGAKYGYMNRSDGGAGTTAIGLLCRMYLGWPRNDPGLQEGAAYLSRQGPSSQDMYYNYYATQVLFHLGGSAWEEWNTRMRDHLIQRQETEGHLQGSWYFNHRHVGTTGGRVCSTAFATMILEVYYRHMPLYSLESTEDTFSE